MKKNTSKKVLNYAAMTAAILGTANAAGQIVYTDIADATLDMGDSFQPIDFDADGTVDILVGLLNFAGGPGAIANGASDPVAPNSFNGNGIVGVPASGFYYPSNIQDGVLIDNTSPVINSQRGDMYVYACYPNSQWCGEVTDGFIGAVFDVAGATHYGWVRMDVLSNGAGGVGSMIVKDFAYNSTPDEGLEAGQQTLSVEDQVFEGFSHFVNNEGLNLKSVSPMSSVEVYNIIGKKVISQNLDSNREVINMGALNTGVYIATVTVEGQTKSFKIVKN